MTDATIEARRLFEEGVHRLQRGDLVEAEKHFREALCLAPGRLSCQVNLANCLLLAGRLDEAEEVARAAIRADLESIGAWLVLAACLEKTRRFAEALAVVDRLLYKHGAATDLELNKGGLLRALGQTQPALELAQDALHTHPDSLQARILAANCLSDLNRDAEALTVLEGLQSRADLAYEGCLCLGNAYKGTARFTEALFWLDAALARHPRGTAARYSRAQLLGESGKLTEATEQLEQLLKEHAPEEDWRFSLCLAYLKLGRYQQAWSLYGARFLRTEKPTPQRLPLGDRRWRGGSFEHLLIWGEQGVGDEIFFLGLAPKIARLPGRKTVAVDSRLLPLLERWQCDIDFVSYEKTTETDCDVHVPIGDLPELLGGFSPDDLRAASPVLSLPKGVSSARSRAESAARLGLSWRGRRPDAREKDLSLEDLLKAVATSHLTIQVLHEDLQAEEIAILERTLPGRWIASTREDGESDILSLARLVGGCNAVVTSSSTTAHVSAGLNVPTAVLVNMGPRAFFYWGCTGSHDTWYPSVQAFHQIEPGDWRHPLSKIADFLMSHALGPAPNSCVNGIEEQPQ